MIIYDTTLRDGSQAEDVHFTVKDKLKIVQLLDKLGVDYIELGWPGSNSIDNEAFEKVKEIKLQTSKIAAFGSTRKTGVSASSDLLLNKLVNSGAQTACIFGKTSKVHVEKQLKTTPEDNLEIIYESIRYLKDNNLEVFYDAEHFFDGYKQDNRYAINCLKKAAEGGASQIILCDTNGGTLPEEFLKIVKEVYEETKEWEIALGVHCHNDSGCAIWNSIVALDYISHIQGTINGFGERCGNADLCQVVPNLVLKKNLKLKTELEKLKHISNMVYTLANVKPFPHQPYVGESAFAHKGGVHTDAMRKGATYEHVAPETIGNISKTVASALGGKGSVVEIANKAGFKIDKGHPNVSKALAEMEELEKKRYSCATLPAEQFLISHNHFSEKGPAFEIIYWKVLSENRCGEFSEALISGRVKNREYSVVAPVKNAGPVGAVFQAMHKLLVNDYPEIKNVKIGNYKVRIAEDKGADSSVRVYVELTDNGNKWATVGVSPNILEASIEALQKGFQYYLLR
ncbi:MAG: citramalate synthase [Candidatus Nanoarchaeia archaeon]